MKLFQRTPHKFLDLRCPLSTLRLLLIAVTNFSVISVDFRLSILKPLHAQWLVNAYNYFTSDKGKDLIAI